MGKFREILSIIATKKEVTGTQNPVTKKESAVVSALKRQIKLLEEINLSYEDTIKDQTKLIRNHKEGNMQERMIDLASSIFMPKPQGSQGVTMEQAQNTSQEQSTLNTHLNPANERHLETGTNYKDNELKEILGYLSKSQLEKVNGLPKDQQLGLIRQKMPSISESSANRMIELAVGML